MKMIEVEESKYANLLTIAGRMLITMFEMYSERYFAAGWMMDLEHTIWERSKVKMPPREEITDHEADLFDILLISTVLQSWVAVIDEVPTVLPLEQWEQIHNAFVLAKSKPCSSQ